MAATTKFIYFGNKIFFINFSSLRKHIYCTKNYDAMFHYLTADITYSINKTDSFLFVSLSLQMLVSGLLNDLHVYMYFDILSYR